MLSLLDTLAALLNPSLLHWGDLNLIGLLNPLSTVPANSLFDDLGARVLQRRQQRGFRGAHVHHLSAADRQTLEQICRAQRVIVPGPGSRTTPARGHAFVVQLQARRLETRMRASGFKAFLSPAGPMFRVRVGPFTQRADADAAAAKARREFRVDTWITASP